MPNLAQIYPEVNESAILNEDKFPTLDLLTVEMIRQQVMVSNTTVASRRKRLALTSHRNRCRTTKTQISIKELNLEETILYPTALTLVSCQGMCHKQQVTNAYHYMLPIHQTLAKAMD